ncbi:MAG TPA: DUF1311 domain-containing protein [Oligoflexia bacterium]|nr:DUF1311 domain-containing protein [Oligoflexia bacterium]HMR24406.1 DUF1311 domain-containing protein [Oligoflexia bacterium]
MQYKIKYVFLIGLGIVLKAGFAVAGCWDNNIISTDISKDLSKYRMYYDSDPRFNPSANYVSSVSGEKVEYFSPTDAHNFFEQDRAMEIMEEENKKWFILDAYSYLELDDWEKSDILPETFHYGENASRLLSQKINDTEIQVACSDGFYYQYPIKQLKPAYVQDVDFEKKLKLMKSFLIEDQVFHLVTHYIKQKECAETYTIVLNTHSCSDKKHKTELKVQPSFSCQGKLSKTEKMICENGVLAGQDKIINEIYQKAIKVLPEPKKTKELRVVLAETYVPEDRQALLAEQRNFIKEREQECGAKKSDEAILECLIEHFAKNLGMMELLKYSYKL